MPERPSEDEIRKWHMWFAVEANNRAWRLTELAEPTAADRAEALLTAYASVYHWSRVGTEHNAGLGDLLLARVHVLMHDPVAAGRCADRAYAYFTSRNSEPWEMAFAHAIMADTAAANGETSLHREHYERARELGELLGAEDKAVFLATFDLVPVP